MSTTALNGLLAYLYGTLTPSNMRWIAEHLMEQAKAEEKNSLQPYSIEELHERIAESERQIAAGLSQDSEEMFRELEAEFAIEELELAETV